MRIQIKKPHLRREVFLFKNQEPKIQDSKKKQEEPRSKNAVKVQEAGRIKRNSEKHQGAGI